MTAPDPATRERYEPSAIEPKWQAYWEQHGTFRARRREGKKKLYVLDMFPYPSGSGLHVGHPEGYTATDIVARFARMRDCDVLHPMGWDAFGLPAEQHAIATNTHPRDTTRKNIETFRRQLKMLGFSYDWSREIDTTDPGYVKWTQWIFLKMFERGLAFQANVPVNWCPALGTVLANEEVIDGLSERGGHPVERLPLRQWMLKITAYADRLADDLGSLDWPDTKGKQLHWIGRSEGAEIVFDVVGASGESSSIRVFTTRADTLPGVTYVVLAPEHPLVAELSKTVPSDVRARVDEYVAAAAKKSDFDRTEAKTKTGVPLGVKARNPINGEEVPVWVGDYVIATYGTGAVMAVPAHDERDHAFAQAYGLPIVQVVLPAQSDASVDVTRAAYTDDGVTRYGRIALDVPQGTASAEARSRIASWLASQKKGGSRVTYRLRDWVFSRQRYWGEPIPIYFPVSCDGDPRVPGAKYTVHYDEPIAVDEASLPLRLPDLDDFRPGSDPAGPLARAVDWRFFQKDGRWFARETNTMPQWAGSCWYYLRFLDDPATRGDGQPWTPKAYADWMPVDLYVGGSEHAVLHLLYARFWHKVLFDVGVVRDKEPFAKLVHQGMILGENNEKMSKARGNVVNPDDVVRQHGADALRLYEMFMGPLEQVKPWQTSGIEGVRKFLDRAWNVATGTVSSDPADYDLATRRLVHKTIKKVTSDIELLRFNTAVSAMMILVKHLGSLPRVPVDAAKALTLILSPFAPHLSEELWQRLNAGAAHESLAYAPWPEFDPELVRDEVVEMGVQVNGKFRGTITVAADADEATAREVALADARISVHLEGKTMKKVIYVKAKILNFIVG